MQIWPAIDLIDGSCVRLVQGDFQRKTTYGSSPADMASRWVSEGAKGLHIIDLDGALGRAKNRDAISQIANEVSVDLQVGGGIRSAECIEEYLEMGIKRLVISTKAIEDRQWIESMANRYANHLVVSIDARSGRTAFDGWRKSSSKSAFEHAVEMSQLPLAGLIYTNIDRAGMMTGPDVPAIMRFKDAIAVPIISSGGVSSKQHVQQLAATKVEGCIIGRALYDGRLTLPDAIASTATAGITNEKF